MAVATDCVPLAHALPGCATSALVLRAVDGRNVRLVAGACGLHAGAIVALSPLEMRHLMPGCAAVDARAAHPLHFGTMFGAPRATLPYGTVALVPLQLSATPSPHDATVAWRPLALHEGVPVTEASTKRPNALELVPQPRSGGTMMRLCVTQRLAEGARFELSHPAEFARVFQEGPWSLSVPTVSLAPPASGAAARAYGASVVVHLRITREVARGELLRADAAACVAMRERMQRADADAFRMRAALAAIAPPPGGASGAGGA
jgi:hypothetical protein